MNETRIKAIGILFLRSMCGVNVSDIVRNILLLNLCGLGEDIVTRIKKGTHR